MQNHEKPFKQIKNIIQNWHLEIFDRIKNKSIMHTKYISKIIIRISK